MKAFKFYLIYLILLICLPNIFANNPIDENLAYIPVKADDYKIITHTTGSYDDPGSLVFTFSVRDRNSQILPLYTKSDFRIYIGEKKVNNFFFQSFYREYKISIPRLPYQKKNNYYNLKIKLTANDKIYEILNKKNHIKYRSQDKRKINLILIIDTSASMQENDKLNFRKKALHNIVNYIRMNRFVSKIAIIKFSSVAEVICPLTSARNIGQLRKAIDRIDSKGDTNIGDALKKALLEIENNSIKEKYITILLTDGKNGAPYFNEHLQFKKYNAPIYTIGLTERVDNSLLNKIAETTGGEYYKIPESFNIQNIYLKVINKEANKKIFLSRDIILKPSRTTNIAFFSDKTIRKMNIFSSWEKDDIIVTTRPRQKQYELNKYSKYQSFYMKNLKSSKYFFKIINRSRKTNFVSLFGYINSDLYIKSKISKGYNFYKEPVELSVLAYQDNSPLTDLTITAHIRSKHTNCRIKLYDDGFHNDENENDGVYKNYFFNAKPGNYRLTYSIKGKNLSSDTIYREKSHTFYVDRMENKNLTIMPLPIDFQTIGAELDCYQSFRLLSNYTNHIRTEIVPLSLSSSNKKINLSEKIKIKPEFVILGPRQNKLFNININIDKKEMNGDYKGNLLLMINNDLYNIPLHLNYYKYHIPENSALIRR